ncbi:MAG TPA: rhomboid family intramembrane serine protease [Candidatus Acidoferrum sp.]|nr:rhomboid family intramembrane serine protease [Candidatus Acidoferrum sp.]
MLIPLRHENMQGRRWPIITFALIGLNVVIFLGTHWTIEGQQPQRAEVRIHLILLAANHPELQTTPEAGEFIANVKDKSGSTWKQLASPSRRNQDSWDSQMRQQDDPAQLQQDMDTLCQQFDELQDSAILDKYGFVPAHPHAISYLSANFLHNGWLHLIGNMWFLWLAGFILEDNWGRAIYTVFYLLAGAASLQFYAWCSHGSFTPLVGASGAVAALMGAFLVRFPKMKIEMALVALFYRLKFKAPAYWLLPLWLAMEFFYGAALGQGSSVAHWAHVGGFLFGMLGAFIIQKSGLEQKASAAIESEIAWTGDPAVVQAQDALEQGKLDEAASILEKHVAEKPNSTDALIILQQVQWRRNNIPAYQQASVQLIQTYLKAQNADAAWQAYEEFSNSAGGDKLPAAPWLELIRHLESQQNFDRAVSECERLAQTYPQERPALLALLTAGRLSLKKLNHPSEALRFYKSADGSPIPHLDWETNIKAGIADAERVMGTPVGALN